VLSFISQLLYNRYPLNRGLGGSQNLSGCLEKGKIAYTYTKSTNVL
jgi:hypothetical protein